MYKKTSKSYNSISLNATGPCFDDLVLICSHLADPPSPLSANVIYEWPPSGPIHTLLDWMEGLSGSHYVVDNQGVPSSSQLYHTS